MSSPFTDLLGESLQTKQGTKPTAEVLKDKEVVGLYFSAHWCPPCRGFTPVLAKQYQALLDANKSFEIVFVSSDRAESDFGEYYAEMPWVSLPFAEKATKQALSSKFKVSGIPTLVLLNGATGELITTKGRNKVMQVEDFPWTPKTVSQMLGDKFVKAGGEDATVSSRVLGLYFSAHWCGPCRGFTPVLAEKYKALKDAGKDIEIVFVSSDRDQKSFDEYLATMPWLALPYDKRKEKAELSDHFDVEGIPTLVFVDKATGKTINKDGRAAISTESFIEDYPFHPKPVNDLSAGPGEINSEASLIVLMEAADAEAQAAAEAALLALAEPELLKVEQKRRVGAFFTAKTRGDIAAKVRQMTGLPSVEDGAAPRVVLMDIPDSGGYYAADADFKVTAETLESFVADYKDKKLERKQLS